jgi:hypothetical protein
MPLYFLRHYADFTFAAAKVTVTLLTRCRYAFDYAAAADTIAAAAMPLPPFSLAFLLFLAGAMLADAVFPLSFLSAARLPAPFHHSFRCRFAAPRHLRQARLRALPPRYLFCELCADIAFIADDATARAAAAAFARLIFSSSPLMPDYASCRHADAAIFSASAFDYAATPPRFSPLIFHYATLR